MKSFEAINAFLSVSEKDIDDYIYYIFDEKGDRDAIRDCMKLYRCDRVRAREILRCIISERN